MKISQNCGYCKHFGYVMMGFSACLWLKNQIKIPDAYNTLSNDMPHPVPRTFPELGKNCPCWERKQISNYELLRSIKEIEPT